MKLLHFASFVVAIAALTLPISADSEHSVYAEIDSDVYSFQDKAEEEIVGKNHVV